MSLSEKTAKQLDGYINRLVKRQPLWLKKLFVSEQICFAYEEDGSLELAVDPTLPEFTREKARILIAKYLDKNPCLALREYRIH
jgi:hypothetical protein